jgi:hypothetical protein
MDVTYDMREHLHGGRKTFWLLLPLTFLIVGGLIAWFYREVRSLSRQIAKVEQTINGIAPNAIDSAIQNQKAKNYGGDPLRMLGS